MAAVMFDTHAVIKRLQEAGFSEQQAETMAGVLQDTQHMLFEHLTTKWDIQALQRDIEELEANTKRDLKEDADDFLGRSCTLPPQSYTIII